MVMCTLVMYIAASFTLTHIYALEHKRCAHNVCNVCALSNTQCWAIKSKCLKVMKF